MRERLHGGADDADVGVRGDLAPQSLQSYGQPVVVSQCARKCGARSAVGGDPASGLVLAMEWMEWISACVLGRVQLSWVPVNRPSMLARYGQRTEGAGERRVS
ncbi:hypothetical protein GCM10010400_01550 [Streptomyces aculeolatus]